MCASRARARAVRGRSWLVVRAPLASFEAHLHRPLVKMPWAATGALKLSSPPSSTAFISPSLMASTLSPSPFLGRSASSASLAPSSVHPSRQSLTRSPTTIPHSRSWASNESGERGSVAPTRLSSLSTTSYAAALREARFDTSCHRVVPQLPWSSRTRGDAVPWQTYRATSGLREGPLQLHRGDQPRWVVKAPGTGTDTFERKALPPLKGTHHLGRRPAATPSWDARFHLDHPIGLRLTPKPRKPT